ncbi:GFA family protein [Kiloniella laminariae]|uniref:GFA family protein n=1 Tax=Kiloniella laminariae TaxID=454162 RepID=A0ABT4LHW3_9PROT|nr:GFA family protein [Kiloniella laminariae]MCZ4280694.1 GFA family protein [Kiloniella laminariae]
MKPSSIGSCLCQQVSFEITGEFEQFYLCHCQHCQKDTGSAHAANLFSTTAKLKWVKGKENVKTFILPETRHVKCFCSCCGSPLPNFLSAENLLVVPAGCLDTELTVQPYAHIFISSRATWDEGLENIPMMAGPPG